MVYWKNDVREKGEVTGLDRDFQTPKADQINNMAFEHGFHGKGHEIMAHLYTRVCLNL